jgi:hypothetical protein
MYLHISHCRRHLHVSPPRITPQPQTTGATTNPLHNTGPASSALTQPLGALASCAAGSSAPEAPARPLGAQAASPQTEHLWSSTHAAARMCSPPRCAPCSHAVACGVASRRDAQPQPLVRRRALARRRSRLRGMVTYLEVVVVHGGVQVAFGDERLDVLTHLPTTPTPSRLNHSARTVPQRAVGAHVRGTGRIMWRAASGVASGVAWRVLAPRSRRCSAARPPPR